MIILYIFNLLIRKLNNFINKYLKKNFLGKNIKFLILNKLKIICKYYKYSIIKLKHIIILSIKTVIKEL